MPTVYCSTVREFEKFIHDIKFTPQEVEKYYKIPPKLLQQAKDCKGKTVKVTEQEQKTIRDALRRDSKNIRVPATTDLIEKLTILSNAIGGTTVSEALHEHPTLARRIVRGECKSTSLKTRKNINKMYHDFKCGLIKANSTDFKKQTNLKHIRYNEYQKALEESRRYLKVLEVGKTYRIYEYMKDSQLNPYRLRFEGKIIEEYNNYYLGTHKDRKVTFLKNLLFLPQYKVEEVKTDEISQLQ